MKKSNENNVLDFQEHLQKRNRINQKMNEKSKKQNNSVILELSIHVLERIEERKITMEKVELCLKLGRKIKKKGAFHYIMETFHVVVDRTGTTIMTAYNKADQKIAA